MVEAGTDFQPSGTSHCGRPVAGGGVTGPAIEAGGGATGAAGADAGADALGLALDPPEESPVSTDFNQAKNFGLFSDTKASSPIILKNTVVPPALSTAARIRALYLPSNVGCVPTMSYILPVIPPMATAAVCESSSV